MALDRVIARAVGFLAVWLILAGANVADLPAMLLAVPAATWASLRLLPPAPTRLSPTGLALLALRYPWQSLVAGVDIAWRALHPRMPIAPGFVAFAPRLPAGTARDAFSAFASLVPGTLPAGTDARGRLDVHALDVGQPVATQLAADEARFARAAGRRLTDG